MGHPSLGQINILFLAAEKKRGERHQSMITNNQTIIQRELSDMASNSSKKLRNIFPLKEKGLDKLPYLYEGQTESSAVVHLAVVSRVKCRLSSSE